jgi:hypothetical protein
MELAVDISHVHCLVKPVTDEDAAQMLVLCEKEFGTEIQ